MNLSYLILGGVTVRVSYGQAAALLNLCMYHCVPYTDFVAESDGVRLTFRRSGWKKLKRENRDESIQKRRTVDFYG